MRKKGHTLVVTMPAGEGLSLPCAQYFCGLQGCPMPGDFFLVPIMLFPGAS